MIALLAAFGLSALLVPHEEKSFVSFMRAHGLLYTGWEYHFRLGVFLTHARFVKSFRSPSFTVSLNSLACLTPSEYRARLGSRADSAGKFGVRWTSKAVKAPVSFDWRDKGVVQVVKDQGQCGSCWAFSAVAAQESQWAIRDGVLYSLSEQNLIDCVTTCSGCSGGDKIAAYDYIATVQLGYFNLEDDYPYIAAEQPCAYDKGKRYTQLSGYFPTLPGSESVLLEAIYQSGPAAVSIDAAHTSFQLYSGGIYNEPDCSSTSSDHAVLCVGYGADGFNPFWIVKNSWGTGWGEQGYIRMTRNANNQCCIACAPIIPFEI
jgi:cathepsin L